MVVVLPALVRPTSPMRSPGQHLRVQPGEGEILVKITAAGICHSDLHLAHTGTDFLDDASRLVAEQHRQRARTVVVHHGQVRVADAGRARCLCCSATSLLASSRKSVPV